MRSADLSPTNPLTDDLKLNAALLFASGGDFQDCIDTLELINPQNLNNRQFVDYSLIAAEALVELYDPQSALEVFDDPRLKTLGTGFSRMLRQRLLSIQARAQFSLGNNDLGFKALIDLSKTVKRKADIRDIHDQIWAQISRLPYQYLKDGSNQDEVILAGWLQLGAASRLQQSSPNNQFDIYSEWKQRWKSHPAARVAPTAISRSKRRYRYPDQVALLLPLQDQYKIPSYTVIDGFLEAYYQTLSTTENNRDKAPEIRIYDTSKGSIESHYNQAVQNGADMVIGPLRQPQVERLATSPLLPVPTLSLNRLDNDQAVQAENFYQFGLSPTDELTQIADRAWNKGFRNVLLIVPDSNWGVHSAEFFNDYWVAKGGNLLEDVRYPSSTQDFTRLLKPPLHIDLSEQRGLQIKRFINSRIKFTARRRQDIDLVVVLGYPLKARQIKPALDFLYASDIPVIATSHIYNGSQQEALDRDLSGIQFSSMHWTLPGHLTKELTMDNQLHTAYRHLYAVGHDAFLVYRNLNHLINTQSTPIYGATGLLYLRNNMLAREQKWAEYNRGKVVEIHY